EQLAEEQGRPAIGAEQLEGLVDPLVALTREQGEQSRKREHEHEPELWWTLASAATRPSGVSSASTSHTHPSTGPCGRGEPPCPKWASTEDATRSHANWAPRAATRTGQRSRSAECSPAAARTTTGPIENHAFAGSGSRR